MAEIMWKEIHGDDAALLTCVDWDQFHRDDIAPR